MPLRSLNQFRRLRQRLMRLRTHWLRFRGVVAPLDIEPSFSSRIVASRKGGVTVGSQTLIAFKTLIYDRDHLTGEFRPVRIGARCFIGGGSMILPGVSIGDDCIVGAGAVVSDDVPSRSIVGGNPARILKSNIEVGPFGRLRSADQP